MDPDIQSGVKKGLFRAKHGKTQDGVFARQQLIPWWDQGRIGSARVLVIGAGALGNEVLKNLALTGFRHITICDFDRIETSNLSRTVLFHPADVGKLKSDVAAARTAELSLLDNPDIVSINCDVVWELGLGVFYDADVVLGCLDNVEARMAVNLACNAVGTPWIDAGIHELAGYVAAFDGATGGCYECGITPTQLDNARVRYQCDNVKRVQVASGAAPSVQVVSAIAAGIQCQTAAKLICGQSVSFGKRIYFQGFVDYFDILDIPRREHCNAHVRDPRPIDWKNGNDQELGDFLQSIERDIFDGQAVTLDLSSRRSFVLYADCRRCRTRLSIWKPKHTITENMLYCSTQNEMECMKRVEREYGTHKTSPASSVPTCIDETSYFSLSGSPERLLHCTLEDIGIPSRDIVLVSDGEKDSYIKLAQIDQK